MKMKKLVMLLPLLALLAFPGCMTAQVELRMEYDKLVKAITAGTDLDVRKAEFLNAAANDGAKGVLEYIWNTAQGTKAAVIEDVPDAKISLTTFGFKVTSISKTEKAADAHFMLSVSGTDVNGKAFTAPVMLINMNPAVTAPSINLHWYKISNDSEKIPVYNLIFDYVKNGDNWKITGIKDSGKDALTIEELQEMQQNKNSPLKS